MNWRKASNSWPENDTMVVAVDRNREVYAGTASCGGDSCYITYGESAYTIDRDEVTYWLAAEDFPKPKIKQ